MAKTTQSKNNKSKRTNKINPESIRALRKSLGLHQTEMAKKLKITSRTLTRLETAAGQPSAATLQRLEKFFQQHQNTKKIREFSPTQLIALRKKTGLSQNAFAKKLGLTHTTIRNYENGYSKPALKILQRINQFAASLKR